MASFFDKALGDVDGLEQELLGPDYSYFKQINSPSDMGMSSNGSLSDLTNDITGLIGYVEILSTGGGKASKVNGPLGDKFFLATGAKCLDSATNKKVTRSLYINNVPDGSIPFISEGLNGMDFTEFEGLVPGILSNMNQLNPMQIFQAFMSGSNPACQAVTMPTVDVNNNQGTQTAYVTNTDLAGMNPCWFPNQTNPVSNANCNPPNSGSQTVRRGVPVYHHPSVYHEASFERFTTMAGASGANGQLNPAHYSNSNGNMPFSIFIQVYYSVLGLLGLYLLLKLCKMKRR